jgi:hypothetical protein
LRYFSWGTSVLSLFQLTIHSGLFNTRTIKNRMFPSDFFLNK